MGPSCFAVLFASDSPTDDPFGLHHLFKIAVPVASILASVIGATWVLAGRSYRSRFRTVERQRDHWREASEKSAKQADKDRRDATAARTDLAVATFNFNEAQTARHAAEKQVQALHNDHLAAKTQLADTERARAKLADDLEVIRREVLILREKSGVTIDELDAKTRSLAQLERRMKSALKLEGQLWNARALQQRPKFRDVGRRQRAIISVLNLKGGVGKTTITAHLGAAFARRGYRVLLVDLDLQGSLTSMLVPQPKINQLIADSRLVQHFFNRAAEDKTTKVESYAVEVSRFADSGGLLDVIGTTDKLAYAELNLTMRWLMGTGDRDTRFLLRKALHLMSVSEAYDLVLVDCPPLVNISCVNALAASDYLVVPTTLSRKSTERIPGLFRRIVRNEQFVKYINPRLQVLGLVANRTYREDMTNKERSDWNQLAAWCKDANGQEVTRFATCIPEIKEVRDSEREFLTDGVGGKVEQYFGLLAAEIEGELPSECRRVTKASS